MIKSICVFCGAASGARPEYAAAASVVGAGIARRGLTLIYGGGNVGLMGTVADATLNAGGRAVGVIPRALVEKEVAHRSLTEMHVVGTMHERKALMAEMADAFLVLPGGFGTLDELCEIVTWAQLGFHRKAVAFLNVAGYYDPFLAFIDHSVQEGFVSSSSRDVLLVDDAPDALLEKLVHYTPPEVNRWLERKDL
jgi:hypothetical protein